MSSSECTRKASTNPFFPKGKIKAQLLRNPDVGKVSKEAVSFVEHASTLFLRSLIEQDVNGDDILNLEHVRQATKPYKTFVNLDDVKDNAKRSTVRKVPPSKQIQATMEEAGAIENQTQQESVPASAATIRVVLDQDTYDY